MTDLLGQVYAAAGPYLESLAARPVQDRDALKLLASLSGPLPEAGAEPAEVIERLLAVGTAAATTSSGPRFFHFVTGGVTPAALAADWAAALLDQNAFSKVSSPFAHEVETVALGWLRELFGLPASWGGALVASATFANFTALGCATHWWGFQHGVDTAADGLAELPRMPVLSSGYVHSSARKALQMLGHGRNSVTVCARDGAGRVDLALMRRRLESLKGAHGVIIANAGEVNTGDFDPIAELAGLAQEFGCWLHVDGAFGLFAALSPRTSGLVAGVDRADSIAADGHKWLNVPYESGFALIREPARLHEAFGMPGAAYLPGAGDPAAGYALSGPESSRRARSLPIWATLAAYGKEGHRAMVEKHLDLAQHLAALVDAAPELERLAPVPLCIVCFRAAPPGVTDLDDFNRRLGAALLEDGRVYAGTTLYDGHVALRPAIVNWRTTREDIDFFVDVVRELAAYVNSR
ncbi:pyridoxal phosphate-dependent decarboxylase family protein [Paractinoplanes brasiliensis]|uniref:Glutamate/tyrosine decarboxylase-like PLP-dependent enzyme n=1 Tax=Paractinoplanes brasiliensis TaxID=52695 RepID=A0A4R6J973_9ACTN|nr:pyridoxal-dependent decarboxylase [Actinoplanes brasiliensis]TDO32170.1 glutamate/tyrosine decarboxylase-like PLP-dependent enzyme [Actinoplanes brasiliensis]GID28224.1 aspartate aminotransferase family protein [Actinoplanes brasiliensis]